MRELQSNEVEQVAGGYQGFKIPFFDDFIPAETMKGKPAGALGAAVLGWQIGTSIGNGINAFNQYYSGMSLGVAIHRTVNGASHLPPSGMTITKVEEM
jgi:hypothetical protein